jgi:hypothetical protein
VNYVLGLEPVYVSEVEKLGNVSIGALSAAGIKLFTN